MKDLALKTDWRNAPEPSFKYGLNIFFTPKTIDLAFADAVVQEAYEPLIRELLAAADGREEKIAAWHRSLAGNGLFVRVPAGLECAAPVRIDLDLAERHRVENVVVLAEEGSRVTVVEH